MTNCMRFAHEMLRSIGIAFATIAVSGPFSSESYSMPVEEARFIRSVIDTRFVSEGVAAGDVNRDGKLDVVAGNVWYEAPNWRPHEIVPLTSLDPKTQYSNCFHCWTADLNRDGWVDQIVIGMPGEKALWRENPMGREVPWKEHPIWRSAGNESPLYEDLFRNGKPVLIMGTDDQYLAWFEPAKDPDAEWICHPVSGHKGAGSQRYSHGLGIGDLNGDGQNDIVTTGGYYVQPKDPRSSPWAFVKAELGPDCAHMPVFDANWDRLPDVLSTSAHARGVWWHEHLKDGVFRRHLIDETISETHATILAPLGKSRTLNLITGKRKWAHPPGVDVGSEEPSWLVRYELRRTKARVEWTRQVIDENSGVGTQFVVRDMNRDGLPDIVVSNKNGVFLFAQMSE